MFSLSSNLTRFVSLSVVLIVFLICQHSSPDFLVPKKFQETINPRLNNVSQYRELMLAGYLV